MKRGQVLFSPVGRLDSNHIAAELGCRILEMGLAGQADRADQVRSDSPLIAYRTNPGSGRIPEIPDLARSIAADHDGAHALFLRRLPA